MFIFDRYIWLPGTEAYFEPNSHILPGVGGIAQFSINKHGLRGSETHNENVILTLGGSSTECLFLDQYETWSALYEKYLNLHKKSFTVWNGGKSGKNSFDHYYDLKKIKDSIPNMKTIIIMMGTNDLLYAISGKDYAELDLPWYKQTYIYRGAARFKNRFQYPKESTKLDYRGKVYNDWRKHRHEAKEIFDTLPNLREELDLYAQNIIRINDLGKKMDVDVVFLTQPTLWKTNMSTREKELLWMGGTVGFQEGLASGYYSTQSLEEGMRKFNEKMLITCKNQNIRCFDMASEIPKSTEIFYDDCHFTEYGSYVVAKMLYQANVLQLND